MIKIFQKNKTTDKKSVKTWLHEKELYIEPRKCSMLYGRLSLKRKTTSM